MDPSTQYITWVSDNKLAWTINAAGVGPNAEVQISARAIPQEPMVCDLHPDRVEIPEGGIRLGGIRWSAMISDL